MENKILSFQKRIGVIAKDSKNPHFKNTYASLTQILSEVKPILSDIGVTIMQPMKYGKVGTVLLDGDKVIAEAWLDLPPNLMPQPLGSAITYFRRYTLASLLALEIDDDDGAIASKPADPIQLSIRVLMSCKSLTELADAWKTIGADMQKNQYVMSAKEDMKLKLTPNA